MKTYEVDVQIRLTKRITVEAASEDEAIAEALECADVSHDPDQPERYEQDWIAVREVNKQGRQLSGEFQ